MDFKANKLNLLKCWAFELVENSRFEEAAVFSQVLYKKSPHIAALLLAEDIERNLENPHKAIDFLTFLLKIENMSHGAVEKFEIHQTIARLYSRVGAPSSSLEYLHKSLNLLPKRPRFNHARRSVEYQLASLLASNNQLSQAKAIFDKNLPVKCGNGWTTTTKVINLNNYEKEKSARETPSSISEVFIDGTTSSLSDIKMVYLVAADIKYCTKFGPDLIRAFLNLKSKGIHIHLHGISIEGAPREHQSWETLVTNLENSIGKKELSLSMTHGAVVTPAQLTDIQKKSVYSFERFRILPELLNQYNTPILVADIDQTPLLSPLPLITGDFDITLLKFPDSILNILSLISATLSVFKPTLEGLATAQKLKAYFNNALLDKNSLNWHVDQAGLAVIALTNREAKLSYFNTNTVITNPESCTLEDATKSGAYFWSITNSLNEDLTAY